MLAAVCVKLPTLQPMIHLNWSHLVQLKANKRLVGKCIVTTQTTMAQSMYYLTKTVILFVRSFGPGILRLSNHINAEHFWEHCLLVFHRAWLPQLVECLRPMKISLKCLTTTHCQFGNQTRSQQPFDHQPDALTTELSPPLVTC